jgi:hypothetical protein
MITNGDETVMLHAVSERTEFPDPIFVRFFRAERWSEQKVESFTA